jgi:hypothetical protein
VAWKIPLKYKQRNIYIADSASSPTAKQHHKTRRSEKQISELPSERNDVVKLTYNQAKKYNACPRHGKKFLVKEGGAIYCFAETKGEIFNRCFYHVAFKDGEYGSIENADE